MIVGADFPDIIDEHAAGDSAVTLTLVVPPDLAFFRGHFPGMPVLPGIVQLRWVVDLGERCLGSGRAVSALEAIKFRQVIRPGERLRLDLRYDQATRKLHFRYESEQGIHSSGRLTLPGS